MKLKVVIVDLELSPRAKRLALRIGIPLLVLGGATVAYASVPVNFMAGSTLHAADLNANFTALDARITTLEGAPKAPRFSQAVVEANGTTFEANYNVSTPLTITNTTAGVYLVQWNGADFPNGVAPLVTPSLNSPETIQISGLNEGGTNQIYVVTYSSGVATNGWFTVLLIGK
jgi:hypothetical protein